MALRVDYKNDILKPEMDGKRRYEMTENIDGSFTFEDVTEYEQVGSNIGAGDLNAINAEVNSRIRIVVSDTPPEDTTVLWVKPEQE